MEDWRSTDSISIFPIFLTTLILLKRMYHNLVGPGISRLNIVYKGGVFGGVQGRSRHVHGVFAGVQGRSRQFGVFVLSGKRTLQKRRLHWKARRSFAR
jgi:hypothetical protein